ncbi:RHS repeat-associated core domain-containing protein, partial [Thermoanaerobaculum aquaticum]|uniref:RHS repeat-associated core domain-containing protein n=1 Tax=Thermoanaerobaculum aquaticum TaxID=1312852 RepID=UPI0005718D10
GYELEHQNTSSTYTDDLYFLHARWYFPQVARFLSPDPVRGNHRAPQSFNLFAYVGGNPINFVDPWGLAEAEPLKINYSETVEVSAGGDPCPFAPKNISCEAWQSVKEMQWRMILGWNRPTSRTPVLSATPAPPIMRAARPEEMGWVSSESEADWGTLYGSYGGFLGLELAVAAEVGVYISTNPWDLVLYLQVGAGRGYGAASGWNVGYVMPGISFESLQAQATLAANRAPGASMSFFRREPAGFSVGFRGRGAGLNAVATKTFTVFSARHLAESIYTAVRFGY